VWRSDREAHGIQNGAGGATPHEGRDHADLEAEDRNRRPERQNETPNVEACQDRRVKAETESADMARGAKHRVNCEPDGKVQHHPHYRRRDRGERSGQRFVAPKPFDVGRALVRTAWTQLVVGKSVERQS
jgi:hypothetical protein